MRSFRAFYEDAAKTEAAARAVGYTEASGSLMDFVEPSDYRTGKTFPTLEQARDWLMAEVASRKTVFGAGTIRETEPVERRCDYCVCGGVRALHEYIVDETGVVEDTALETDCVNDS